LGATTRFGGDASRAAAFAVSGGSGAGVGAGVETGAGSRACRAAFPRP
jgi:hypothetical protein